MLVCGQSVNVIPLPQKVVMKEDNFLMKGSYFADTTYPLLLDNLIHDSYMEAGYYFNRNFDLQKKWWSELNILKGQSGVVEFCNRKAIFKILNPFDSLIGNEGYHLNINKDSIVFSANKKEGLFRGICSLQQMIAADSGKFLPCCDIIDYPAYPYRAMHLDVCRHFFSKDFIKRYIDQLAYYKINTLHWHLTDDQGWRIEIKKYPKLTEVGAWRIEKDSTRYGGYYTQEDIKEIVAYAQARYITIIPEIEMPGHSSAALAAYPCLACTNDLVYVPTTWGIKHDIYAPSDTVFRFFEDVMDEVCALFPSHYIHIGGDEAPKGQWKTSPTAQKVIRQNNLRDENELQHYFMHRVENYLNKKGKKAIGWGEVVKGGLSDSITVMSWLGYGQGIKAARHGNDVIMAPRFYCYFDYPMTIRDPFKAIWMLYLPLHKVYRFKPMPKGLKDAEQRHILGGEATLWTEYVTTEEHAWHQLMPRLAALSEALWTKPERKDYRDFKRRLDKIGK
jgi:hexosaminidase